MKQLSFFLMLFTFKATAQSTAPQLHQYKVGDTAFCGIVFYVKDSANGIQRGLICSMQDIQTGIRWFNGNYVKTSSTSDVLYNPMNTQQIIKVQGNGSYAATAAYNLNNSGDSSCTFRFNWYLPAKAELQLLYANLAKNKKVKFSKEGYWSSVESTQVSGSKYRKAWLVDFLNGKTFVSDKTNKYRVRAVKEFRNY